VFGLSLKAFVVVAVVATGAVFLLGAGRALGAGVTLLGVVVAGYCLGALILLGFAGELVVGFVVGLIILRFGVQLLILSMPPKE
jgi:hypothetical protein